MRAMVLAGLVGCGTVRPTCDHEPPLVVGEHEPTALGTVRQLLERLDGAEVLLDDGEQTGLFWIEAHRPGTFIEAVPGAKRTGLPPRDNLLIGLSCDDSLQIDIDYRLEVGAAVLTGQAEVTHTDWFTQIAGAQLLLFGDATHPLSGELTAP